MQQVPQGGKVEKHWSIVSWQRGYNISLALFHNILLITFSQMLIEFGPHKFNITGIFSLLIPNLLN